MANVKRPKLRRRRKKSGSKQNLTYIIILVLLIVFFATVGLQLVLKASLFIAGFSDDNLKSIPSNNSNDILLEPVIYNVPDATNSARIKLSGSATAETKLTVFVNDEIQDEMNLNDDDFESTVLLSKGANTIYVELENKEAGLIKDSKIHTIYFLNEKPTLDIDFPEDNAIVNDTEINIRGKTSEGVKIKVNNSPTVVSGSGNFSKSVRLNEGENKIKLVATDIAGNTTETEITVRYEKDD